MSANELEFSQRLRNCIPSLDLYVKSRTQNQYVDDICSEAIAIAWQKYARIPGRHSDLSHDPLLPFLILTARNLLRNLERRNNTGKRHLRDLVPLDSLSAEAEFLKDLELTTAMAKLKPTDRELLLLLAWQEMSISEISEVLGITKANVSVRLKRARDRLAKILQDTAEEGH